MPVISTSPASLDLGLKLKHRGRGVGDTGGEPEASSPQKTPLLKQGGAESGALFGDDERLRLLLEAWAELPESVKTAVMEMVRD